MDVCFSTSVFEHVVEITKECELITSKFGPALANSKRTFYLTRKMNRGLGLVPFSFRPYCEIISFCGGSVFMGFVGKCTFHPRINIHHVLMN